MKHLSPTILGLISSSVLTTALQIPVQKRSILTHDVSIAGLSTTPGTPASLVNAGAGSSNESDITNSNNMFYTTNLTIGGVEVPVQLDTGSTDLWIYPGSYPGLFANVRNYTNVTVGARYGKGSVEGFLSVANLSFAGFDVDDQAFISVTSSKDFESLFSKGTYGMVGLGFDSLSNVARAVQTSFGATWGRSLLSNLFMQEPGTPNHIAFALERAGDLDDMAEGAFDVGEILPQYTAITVSPPIPLWPENANRWTVLLDAMNVNDSNVPLSSTFEGDFVSDPPEGKSLVLLDTGASLSLIPKWAVEAIYKNIPGSVYSSGDDIWIVPCMAEVAVTFTIGGITIPIHPLDLTTPGAYSTSAGEQVTFCTNTFRTLTISDLPFDFLLGDAFLRNVYTVYDFGDFDTGDKMGKPYVKLLPLTNAEAASASFKKNRAAALAQLPPEGDSSKLPGLQSPVSNSTSANTNTPETTNDDPSPASTRTSVNAPTHTSTTNNSSTGGSSLKAGTNLSSNTTDDDNYSAISALAEKLGKLAPITMALLGINVLLLLVLVAIGAYFLIKRRKQTNIPLPFGGSKARGVYAPVTKFQDVEDEERSQTPVGRYDVPQYRGSS